MTYFLAMAVLELGVCKCTNLVTGLSYFDRCSSHARCSDTLRPVEEQHPNCYIPTHVQNVPM